ncbi:MAG: hypothetical protein B6229_06525 [Spirochaetaceae bacterium 4572_7]|nr:MAG: hypothetical protein B6229_06525 [Spirochaetaceae bacterium 4572_7]
MLGNRIEDPLGVEGSIDGIKTFHSQGNYILFKLDRYFDLAKVLQKDGILVRSCSNYNNLNLSYYRIAVKKYSLNRILILKLNSLI